MQAEQEVVKTGIDIVVEMAKGQVLLGERLGVSQQAVSNWQRQGYVPPGRVREIEAQFGVPRHQLVSPKVRELLEVRG